MLNNNFDSFESALITQLGNITAHLDSSAGNREWTIMVKKLLTEIVKQESANYKCACHSIEGTDWGEWLYDFVSYSYDENGLTNIHLIVECEWKSPVDSSDYMWELQCDFEKLVQARCQYRMMIFEARNEAEGLIYIEKLKNIARKFHYSLPDDHYVFAVWNCAENCFIFQQFSPLN